MKKIALLALLFVASVFGKVNAQYIVFWDGDMRFGFTGGVSIPVSSMPEIICEDLWDYTTNISTKMQFVEGSYKPALMPTFKIYFGMEKEISRDLAFGFQGWIGYGKKKWDADFVNPLDMNTTTYSVTSAVVDANEGIYLAYYLTDDLSLSFGAGISEYFDFTGTASAVTRSATGVELMSNNNVGDKTSPFDLGFGGMLTLGVNYRVTDAFFIGANAVYQKSFFGSGSFSSGDTFFMNSLGNGIYYSNPAFNAIQVLATVGFRW